MGKLNLHHTYRLGYDMIVLSTTEFNILQYHRFVQEVAPIALVGQEIKKDDNVFELEYKNPEISGYCIHYQHHQFFKNVIVPYTLSITKNNYLFIKIFAPRFKCPVHNVYLVSPDELLVIFDALQKELQSVIEVNIWDLSVWSVELARQFSLTHPLQSYFPVFNQLKGNRFAISSNYGSTYYWGEKFLKFCVYDKVNQIKSKLKKRTHVQNGVPEDPHSDLPESWLGLDKGWSLKDLKTLTESVIRAELRVKKVSNVRKHVGVRTAKDLCSISQSQLESIYTKLFRRIVL